MSGRKRNLFLAQVCDFLMSAALSGGSTTLEALAGAGSGVPPQPSDIQRIMEDLAVGSQPEPDHAQQAGKESSHEEAGGGGESAGEPDQAQQAGTEGSQAEAAGGGGAESAGKPDQAQQANTEGSQTEAGGGGGAESAREVDRGAASSSQPDQTAS